jgi:hypothetical protein
MMAMVDFGSRGGSGVAETVGHGSMRRLQNNYYYVTVRMGKDSYHNVVYI